MVAAKVDEICGSFVSIFFEEEDEKAQVQSLKMITFYDVQLNIHMRLCAACMRVAVSDYLYPGQTNNPAGFVV
jgi:hypothetical protein